MLRWALQSISNDLDLSNGSEQKCDVAWEFLKIMERNNQRMDQFQWIFIFFGLFGVPGRSGLKFFETIFQHFGYAAQGIAYQVKPVMIGKNQ